MDATPVAMITGGSGGIGQSVVRHMLTAGWRVCALDTSADALAQLAASVPAERRAALLVQAGDAAHPGDVEGWLRRTLDDFGDVATLINIAGWFQCGRLSELSWTDIDAVLRANFYTTLTTCKIIAPTLVARGAGSIVNFASTAGEYGSISPAAHYAAAKGAVIAFSKSLAREISPAGVRVNVISPGPIDTTGLWSATGQTGSEVADRTLLGRLGTPDEIARSTEYLAGEASSFVTGHVLGVNGGSLL